MMFRMTLTDFDGETHQLQTDVTSDIPMAIYKFIEDMPDNGEMMIQIESKVNDDE